MKTLVTYVSQTGNTKKVADAIYEAIEGEKEIKPVNEVESLEDYGFTFIGTPVINDNPIANVKRFLKRKAAGKKIALFVTHAALPGLEGISNAYFEEILNNCKESAAKSELIGFYNCQGELSEETANMLLKMPDPQLQGFGKLRPETIGHPNEKELENARKFAKETLEKIV